MASFVGLAEGTIAPRKGKPFFTGLKWYRVVPGFVIQSGDPDFEANANKEGNTGPYLQYAQARRRFVLRHDEH